MRITRECFEIAHSVVVGSSLEYIVKSQCGEHCEAAGAAATNGCAVAINPTGTDEIFHAGNDIADVHDTPVAFETLPVGTSKAATAAMVHIQQCKAARGPILDPHSEFGFRVA